MVKAKRLSTRLTDSEGEVAELTEEFFEKAVRGRPVLSGVPGEESVTFVIEPDAEVLESKRTTFLEDGRTIVRHIMTYGTKDKGRVSETSAPPRKVLKASE